MIGGAPPSATRSVGAPAAAAAASSPSCRAAPAKHQGGCEKGTFCTVCSAVQPAGRMCFRTHTPSPAKPRVVCAARVPWVRGRRAVRVAAGGAPLGPRPPCALRAAAAPCGRGREGTCHSDRSSLCVGAGAARAGQTRLLRVWKRAEAVPTAGAQPGGRRALGGPADGPGAPQRARSLGWPTEAQGTALDDHQLRFQGCLFVGRLGDTDSPPHRPRASGRRVVPGRLPWMAALPASVPCGGCSCPTSQQSFCGATPVSRSPSQAPGGHIQGGIVSPRKPCPCLTPGTCDRDLV